MALKDLEAKLEAGAKRQSSPSAEEGGVCSAPVPTPAPAPAEVHSVPGTPWSVAPASPAMGAAASASSPGMSGMSASTTSAVLQPMHMQDLRMGNALSTSGEESAMSTSFLAQSGLPYVLVRLSVNGGACTLGTDSYTELALDPPAELKKKRLKVGDAVKEGERLGDRKTNGWDLCLACLVAGHIVANCKDAATVERLRVGVEKGELPADVKKKIQKKILGLTLDRAKSALARKDKNGGKGRGGKGPKGGKSKPGGGGAKQQPTNGSGE